MERPRQALVRQPYQIGLVARESHSLVQLVGRDDISTQIIDVGALGLSQELVELFGEVDIRRNDDINVRKEYKIGLAIFASDVTQEVLGVGILDTPLFRLGAPLLQQLVQRLLWFGTTVFSEVTQMNAANVRGGALFWYR